MSIWVAQWRVNGPIDGIGETYYGTFDDRQDAMNAAITTMRIRLTLLADNARIVQGRVSLVRDGDEPLMEPNAPDSYRIPGLPLVGVPADPGATAGELSTNIGADSIHVQLRTNASTLANRHLRYCPDRWTRASVFQPAGLADIEVSTQVGVPPLAPDMATGATPAANLTLFLRAMLAYWGGYKVTQRFVRGRGQVLGRPKQFLISGYVYGSVIRPATRRTGRPFGPFRGRRSNSCPKKKCK